MTISEIKERLKNNRFGRQKDLTKTKVAVFSQRPGVEVLPLIQKLFAKEGAIYNPTPIRSSVGGFVQVKEFQIIVKPLGKTGLKLKHGIPNELKLVSAINAYIADNEGKPLTVIFQDSNKQHIIPNVKAAHHVARETSGDRKADVVLSTTNGSRVPISLKKDNAEFWGGVASYWGPDAVKLLEKLVKEKKVKMQDRGGYVEIEPKVAVKANWTQTQKVVFGSDLQGHGFVFERTFEDSDFSLDNEKNILTISGSKIIKEVNDVDGKRSVWFIIINNKARKDGNLPRGLQLLAAYQSRVTGPMLKVAS